MLENRILRDKKIEVGNFTNPTSKFDKYKEKEKYISKSTNIYSGKWLKKEITKK